MEANKSEVNSDRPLLFSVRTQQKRSILPVHVKQLPQNRCWGEGGGVDTEYMMWGVAEGG